MTITLGGRFTRRFGFPGWPQPVRCFLREFPPLRLRGSVIVSGVIAPDGLSPMMCSILLRKHGRRGASAKPRQPGVSVRWTALVMAGGSDRSLELFGPITGLFRADDAGGSSGSCGCTRRGELAPEEDQGIVFAVTKAPKIRQHRTITDFLTARSSTKAFAGLSGKTDLRFVLKRPSTVRRAASPAMLAEGRGMMRNPFIDQAENTAGAGPSSRRSRASTPSPSICRRCRAGPGGFAGADGDQFRPSGFQAVL